MCLRPMVPGRMEIETEVTGEAVRVAVGGEEYVADRDWWEEWTASIDGDPETCLAACLED